MMKEGCGKKVRGHYTSSDLVHREANGSPSGCWLMVGSCVEVVARGREMLFYRDDIAILVRMAMM